MVGRKRGFVWLYGSSLFSAFWGSDACFPEMFGGGELGEKFVKAGFRVVLFEMGLNYLPMGCIDSCLKDKGDGGLRKTSISMTVDLGE